MRTQLRTFAQAQNNAWRRATIYDTLLPRLVKRVHLQTKDVCHKTATKAETCTNKCIIILNTIAKLYAVKPRTHQQLN